MTLQKRNTRSTLRKSLSIFFAKIIFLSFLITSCTPTKKQITPAFYHWQTNFSLAKSEKDYLQNFPIKKIYVKFFDIDWNAASNAPLPVAEVILDTLDVEDIEIIPTIFITNRSLKNYPLAQMETLGERILNKIFTLKNNVPEIQIDCDWSETTEEKYFRLLRFLKKEMEPQKIKLSATIRLHQIKYFDRTGVPPVDRGMLMFYNVDNVRDFQTENSILDMKVAQQYFYNFENYPLELDVALPIFSWGVLFRGGQMIKLMTGLRAEDLVDTTFFMPAQIDNFESAATLFEVKKSTYLEGRYLYAGDEIRLETVSLETLNSAANSLSNHLGNYDKTVSFYHLDTATIKHYPYEELRAITQIFEK